ncbi:MAG: hypothetical protein AAFN92_19595, partial [Bacteroidota bacterium]
MYWKNLLLILLFTGLSTGLHAQIKDRTAAAPAPTDIFRPLNSKAAAQAVGKEIGEFGLLETDAETYAQLLATAPEEWTLQLPPTADYPGGFTLQLRENDFLRYDFRLQRASDGGYVNQPDLGKHYVGEIVGEPGSRVALSLLETE